MLANLSALESLQASHGHSPPVFNQEEKTKSEQVSKIYSGVKNENFAWPSWDELKAAYSPKNVGRSLALTAGGTIGGALIGAKAPVALDPRLKAIGGAIGGGIAGGQAAVNRPIGEWK